MENNNKKDKIWWRPAFEIFSEVSTWIAVPIILALILGKYLDKRYDSEPLMLLLLAGFGFLVSSYGIVRSVNKYVNKIKKENKEKKD